MKSCKINTSNIGQLENIVAKAKGRTRKTKFDDIKRLLLEKFESLSSNGDFENDTATGYIFEFFNPDPSNIDPEFTKKAIFESLYDIKNNESIAEVEDKRIYGVENTPNILSSKMLSYKYGGAQEILNKHKQHVKSDVIKHAFVNVQSQRYAKTQQDVTNGIIEYQQELWKQIVHYLNNYVFTNEKDKLPLDLFTKTLSEGYIYNKTLENHQSSITSALTFNGTLTTSKLKELNSKEHKQGKKLEQDQAYINAFNAFNTLQHFDSLLKEIFGRNVSINEFYVGRLTANHKYKFNNINAMQQSWNTNETTTIEDEIDNVTQTFIEIIPLLNHEGHATGNFMHLRQFTSILAKVRELSGTDFAKNIQIRTVKHNGENIYNDDDGELDYLIDNNISTLQDLLAHVRNDGIKAHRLLYKYLNSLNSTTVKSVPGIYFNDLQYIKSIYDFIFVQLYNVYAGSKAEHNYYDYLIQFMGTFSSLKFSQTYIEDRKISSRNMRRGAELNTISNINSSINSNYNVQNPNRFKTLSDKLTINIETKKDKGKDSTYFTFILPGTTVKIPYLLGNGVQEITVNNIDDYEKNIKELFESILAFQIPDTFYQEFYGQYLLTDGKNTTANYNLLNFCADSLMHIYFNNVEIPKLLKDNKRTLSDVEQAYSDFFNSDEAPKKFKADFIKPLGQYNNNSKNIYPILQVIARAYDIARGITTRSTVKNSEGNDIGAMSPSRLFEGNDTQIKNIKETKNSALSGLSVVSGNLIKDIIIAYELEDQKTHMEFSPNEIFYEGFLIDFLQKVNDSDNSEIWTIPMILSDKSILEKVIIDANNLKRAMAKRFAKPGTDENGIDQIIQKNKGFNFNNVQENTKLILDFAKLEFGEVYYNIINNIEGEYEKLNKYIKKEEIINSIVKRDGTQLTEEEKNNIFDYTNDFALYNNLGIRTLSGEWKALGLPFLQKLIEQYQQSGGNIRIIEEIHYVPTNKGMGPIRCNRALVSQAYRMSSEFKSEIDEKFGDHPMYQSFTDFKSFIANREKALLEDLLNNKFEVDLDIDLDVLKKVKEPEEWVDKTVNKLYLAKLTYTDSKGKEQKSYVRTSKQYNRIKDLVGDENLTIELHPRIKQHNWLQYYISQSVVYAHMGIPEVNPTKKAVKKYNDESGNPNYGGTTDLEEISERFTAATKRNVTESGSMNLYNTSIITGMGKKVKIACIEDIFSDASNYVGDSDPINVFDGAIFSLGCTTVLQNNSLGGSKGGYTHKPLFHDLIPEFGSGVIIKPASHPMTNKNQRESHMFKTMTRKCLSVPWNNPNINVTEDYDGDYINWVSYIKTGKFVQVGSEKVEIFKKRYKLEKIENSDKKYRYIEELVDINGNKITEINGQPVESIPVKNYVINSNYDLYQWFGAENSVSFNQLNQLSQLKDYGEISNYQLAKAMNFIGFKKTEKAVSIDDVDQPLKDAAIHFVVPRGAIKKGIANVNVTEKYENDEPFSYIETLLSYVGIQLDKTHEAEGAKVSILTQVINALTSRGFTGEQANEVYKAIKQVTLDILEPYTSKLIKIFTESFPEQYRNELKNDIAQIILEGSSGTNNALLKAVTEKYVNLKKSGANFGSGNVNIPLSDPSIFQSAISNIISSINKQAIRMKFDGMLAVLTPSHNIFKLFNGKLLSSFTDYNQLAEEQKNMPSIKAHQMALGTSYNVYDSNGKFIETISITNPNSYWKYRNKYKEGFKIKEQLYREELVNKVLTGDQYYDADGNFHIATTNLIFPVLKPVRKIIPVGRNLESYNVFFSDITGKESFSLWDLDIVYQMWKLQENKKQYSREKFDKKSKELRNQFQAILSGIHQKNLSQVNVVYFETQGDGTLVKKVRTVNINLNSVKTKNYECILPYKYFKEFNIPDGTRLQDINKDFFKERIKKSFRTKVANSNYDIEIKRANGEHIYLIDSTLGGTNLKNLSKVEQEIQQDTAGNYYSTDYLGRKQYKLSSNSDTLYKDISGNIIIVTDNIEHYLNQYKGIDYSISNKYYKLKRNEKELSQDKLNKLSKIFSYFQKSKFYRANRYYDRFNENGIINTGKLYGMDANYDEYVDRIAEKRAIEMYSSFQMSLNVLAARIPSQSMQSFMSMKIAAFDESGTTNASVSIWQLWLQGSDFDIDTVSMLGYQFDKNGKFLHWSPLANFNTYETLHASTSLPFPTGIETKIEVDDINGLPENIAQLINDIITNYYVDESQSFNFGVDGTKKFADLIRMVNSLNGIITVGQADYDTIKQIITLVNHHNSYIKNLKENKYDILPYLKNYISANMFSIIENPVNIIQAQSSIDGAVNNVKAIAENTEKAKNTTRNTPGNSYNYGLEMNTNMTGKTCTGITAAGMKALLGITHATNSALNQGEVSNVVFNKTIGQITYTIAGNSYTANITNDSVRQALLNVRNEDDALLVLSALLSLSTDNAKELVLDKINATEELISMYIYGIDIGMKFTDISEILISETINEASRIMKGNIFNNKQPLKRFGNFIDYIECGPNMSQYKFIKNKANEIVEQLSQIFSKDSDVGVYIENLAESKKQTNANTNIPTEDIDAYGYFEEGYDGQYDPEYEEEESKQKEEQKYFPREIRNILMHPSIDWSEEITVLNSKGKSVKMTLAQKVKNIFESLRVSGTQKTQQHRFAEEFENWVDFKTLIKKDSKFWEVNGTVQQTTYFDMAKQLYYGGTEMTKISTIFGINQGMDTTITDFVKFRFHVENIFNDLYSQYSKNEFIREEQLNKIVMLDGNQTSLRDVWSKIASYTNDKYKDKIGSYGISMNLFFTDEAYRNRIIQLYNAVKDTHNVPYIIYNNHHYSGYLQSVNDTDNLLKEVFQKYALINKYAVKIIENYNFRSHKDIDSVIKKVIRFVDRYMINSWLTQDVPPITVPAGGTISDADGNVFTTAADTPIVLGTEVGNRAFTTWMENTVIPDLKEGRLNNSSDPYALGNLFIDNLDLVAITNTVSKNAITVYSLPIEMIPKNPEEENILSMYQDSMLDTVRYNYFGYNVLDLIYLYNQIAHEGRSSAKSFTKLFEPVVRDESLQLDVQFKNFVNKFDKEFSSKKDKDSEALDIDIDYQQLLQECSPVGSVWNSYSKYTIDYNKDTLQYELFKRDKGTYTSAETELKQYNNIEMLSLHKGTIRISNDIVLSQNSDGWNIITKDISGKIVRYTNKDLEGILSNFGLNTINDLFVYQYMIKKDGTLDKYIDPKLTKESIELILNNPC